MSTMSAIVTGLDACATLGVLFGFFAGWVVGRQIDLLLTTVRTHAAVKADRQRAYLVQRAKGV